MRILNSGSMALDSLAVPLVQVFESNITNARMILGAMGSADLLRAFRLTQKLEDYIIDIMEQIESVREQASSRSSILKNAVSDSGRRNDDGGATSPSTTKPRNIGPTGGKRRGAAGSSRSNLTPQKPGSLGNSNLPQSQIQKALWQHPALRTTSSEEDEGSLPPNGNGVLDSPITDMLSLPEVEENNMPVCATDYLPKSEPFPAFPSGSVFPGQCPDSPQEESYSPDMDEEVLATVPQPPEAKRARQQHSTKSTSQSSSVPPEEVWRVAACLLPGPDVERAPSAEQVTEWTLAGQGLPHNQDSVMIDRRWNAEQLAEFMCSLYPDYPQLMDIGYILCIADMDNCLSELRESDAVDDLASVVGAGPLYIRPKMNLPVPSLNSVLPSLASTPSKKRKHACSQCGRWFTKRWSLKRHETEQHTNRSYKCRLCGASFKRRQYLRDHQLTRHVEEELTGADLEPLLEDGDEPEPGAASPKEEEDAAAQDHDDDMNEIDPDDDFIGAEEQLDRGRRLHQIAAAAAIN